MRLIRAKISYFRQYKKTEIYFPDTGMIGILGVNGAGKSTLFNAIQWGLYGKIKDITSSMIKNQMAGKKDPCFVEFDFEYQQKYYRVHRDMVSSKCYVQVDGFTRAVGTSAMNQFIEEEVFKMDHKTFCTCYYAEQDDFDALVKLNPGPRVQMLTKLVRIEAIDQAIELTRKEKRALESKIMESRKRLRDENELNDQLNQVLQRIEHLQKEIQSCDALIEKQDQLYKNLLVKRAEGDQLYRKFLTYANYIQKEENDRSNLERLVIVPAEQKLVELHIQKERFDLLLPQIENLPDLKAKKEKLTQSQLLFQEKTQVSSDLERVRLEIQKYEEDIAAIQNELRADHGISAQLAEKENEALSIGQKVNELREVYQELGHDAKVVKANITEKEETKRKFHELGEDAPCPTCERPLGEHYGDKMHHLEEELAALNKKMQKIKDEGMNIRTQGEETKKMHEALLKQIEAYRKRFVENEKREERLASLVSEREQRLGYQEKLMTRYEAVKEVAFDAGEFRQISTEIQTLTPLSEEVIKLGARLQEIPQLELQIRDAKNNILLHDDAIKGFVREQKSIGFDEASYLKLSEETEEAQLQKTKAMEMKQELSTSLAIEGGKQRNLQEKLEDHTKLVQEIKTDEEEISFLGKLDKVFAAYKIDKLAKLSPALSDIMSELMERITDGKYDRVELDDSYNIQIYRNNVKNPLEFYSGGEKKLAALCQRLAISNLLVSQTGQSNFELLAMDEVFGSMDNARQDGLLEMLRNLNEVFPQILMVTHSDYVKDSFDYVLEIKTDTNGYSYAAWENPWDDSPIREKVDTYNRLLEAEEPEGDEAV